MAESGLPLNSGDLADDFRDCIDCLNANAVVYVLVGGYAMGWHGVVRATGDIDFLYEQTPANVDRLSDALHDFGAPPQLIDREFMLSPGAVTQIGTAPLRIDLLASLTGVTFAEVFGSAVAIELEGRPLRVIGLEALRKNKMATGRAKDRRDARSLPRGTTAQPDAPGRPRGKATPGRGSPRRRRGE